MQRLAGPEKRAGLCVNGNDFPGARIAACAGIALPDGKTSEASQFNPIAPDECCGDFIKNGINDSLNNAPLKVRMAFRQAQD